MKCKMCSNEFDEGVFCPECGAKYEGVKLGTEDDVKERECQEVETREQECKEIKENENGKACDKENVGIQVENVETRRLEQENVKMEMESRTVRGVMYKTLEEAEKARSEHNKIDLLKEKLLTTKSQKKRQIIFKEFNESIEVSDVKNRYDLLAAKVSVVPAKVEKLCTIYGYSILIAFFISCTLMSSEEISMVGIICSTWTGFGFWIWPVWKMVKFIKSKSANHYTNIKKI